LLLCAPTAQRSARRPCYSTRPRPLTPTVAVRIDRGPSHIRRAGGGRCGVYGEDRSIRRCCRINRARHNAERPGNAITFVGRQRPRSTIILLLFQHLRSRRQSRMSRCIDLATWLLMHVLALTTPTPPSVQLKTRRVVLLPAQRDARVKESSTDWRGLQIDR